MSRSIKRNTMRLTSNDPNALDVIGDVDRPFEPEEFEKV